MLNQDQEKRAARATKNYMKYSGIAFQMVGILLISFIFGKWIDAKIGNKDPLIAILFSMLAFGGYMYKLYRELK